MNESKLDDLVSAWKQAMGWGEKVLQAVPFTLACYLTPWLPGNQNPAWGIQLGASGIGKSSVCNMLMSMTGRTLPLDHMTENALTSHYVDEETGKGGLGVLDFLSHKRPPEGPKVLLMSEFSSITSTKSSIAQKQLAVLRQAYDGHFSSAGGNDGFRIRVFGRCGVIIAGTDYVEQWLQDNQMFGERILKFRWPAMSGPDRLAAIRSARSSKPQQFNQGQGRIWTLTADILNDGIKRLDSLKDAGWETCTRSPHYDELLDNLAFLSALIRCGPHGDDMGTRLVLQFRALGDACAILAGRTEWTPQEFGLVQRVARDTPPPASIAIVRHLYGGDLSAASDARWPEDIRRGIGLSSDQSDYLHKQLRQWANLGLLQLENERYRLEPHVAQMIHDTEFLA